MNPKKLARKFEQHYLSHGADVKISLYKAVIHGDRLIFDVRLNKGTREDLVFDRASDIGTALGLTLFQPFRDGLPIRLAVSNRPLTVSSLLDMFKSQIFRERQTQTLIALGNDLMGRMIFVDLAESPHLMIGGATNSGKTVALRSLILSIAVKQSINRVNLVIIDSGATGLDVFASLHHLSCPIVKDSGTAVGVLFGLMQEMERRATLPAEELCHLPAVVVVIDEYTTLVRDMEDTEKKKALTSYISGLLRRGRHAKIHIVLATQEPAKGDMLINLNNLNARMALKCSDFYSSRSVIGEGGAEKLPGAGAMLFKAPGSLKPIFLQGAYISTQEIEALVARIASASHDVSQKFLISDIETLPAPPLAVSPSTWGALSVPQPKVDHKANELAAIIMWALGRDNISSRQMQETFHIGAPKANTALYDLTRMGIASEKFSKQPRTVLPRGVGDLSAEVIELLERHGHTSDQIQAAIDTRE